MTEAVVAEVLGSPEVLSLRHIEVGEPGVDEIGLRQRAIGGNFVDL